MEALNDPARLGVEVLGQVENEDIESGADCSVGGDCGRNRDGVGRSNGGTDS